MTPPRRPLNRSQITSYHQERYGAWAGNPDGRAANPEHCAEDVCRPGTYLPAQCSRKRGYGPEEAFCRQHAKRYGKGYA